MAIEDYFEGSSQAYGKIAGSLLSGRRKEDKKEAKRALLASTVMATFGALQNQQKQTIIDGANDVREKYDDIFNLNKSEFEAYSDERALLKKYNNPQTRESFLNEEVAKIINNTDEATAARVTWNDIDNEPDEELRKSMYAAHNSEKQKLVDRMEKLKLDPRATTKTFTQYNQRATDEYRAALALVEDDPTKKGLIRAAWNRIFKTKRNEEGELVTTNSDLLDLQDALVKAKENRTTFRDLKDREVVKRSLITPLVFKDKDVDMSKVYLEVGNKLANVAGGYEKYKGTDRRFIDNVIDTVIAEDATLSQEEILNKSLGLIRGETLNVKGYLTREANKEATGRLLIETFNKQSEDEKIEKFKNNPSLLYQVADAYNNAGDRAMAGNVLETYKDINPEYENYEPNPNILTNRVGTIEQRIKNDPTRDELIIQDRTYMGNLANRVAHTEHLFKYNNPDWSEEFTEPELTNAAISFVLDRDDSQDPTNVRMTKAHMLPYKQNITEEYILDILPDIVNDFNKSYLNEKMKEKEILTFRKGFIGMLKDRELEPDEVITITDRLDNLLPVSQEVIDENNITLESIPNITDVYKERGVIKRQEGRNLTYLTNWEENMDKLDLSTLSMDDLGYLASIRGDELYNYLGLDTDVSLTPFRVQGLGFKGGIKTLRANAREAMEKRIANERKISKFKADGIVSGMFMNKDNDWNTLKNDETINTFFETLKTNILS
jgi:hypothetical protein